MHELNITPLLDLVFVLLVIFIITTPQMMNNLEMTLPSGKPPPPDQRRNPRSTKSPWKPTARSPQRAERHGGGIENRSAINL